MQQVVKYRDEDLCCPDFVDLSGQLPFRGSRPWATKFPPSGELRGSGKEAPEWVDPAAFNTISLGSSLTLDFEGSGLVPSSHRDFRESPYKEEFERFQFIASSLKRLQSTRQGFMLLGLLPMSERPIETTGIIREVLPARVFRVELPNGKLVIGHLPARLAELAEKLASCIRVDLELTPFDFEKARIVGLADNSDE